MYQIDVNSMPANVSHNPIDIRGTTLPIYKQRHDNQQCAQKLQSFSNPNKELRCQSKPQDQRGT